MRRALLYRGAHRVVRIWWRFRRPTSRGVRIILHDGRRRVVLVRHAYGAALWYLPGGGVKRGESPDQAGVREIHEELGIALPPERLVVHGEYSSTREGKRDEITVLRAEIILPNELGVASGEIASVRVCSLDALPTDTSPATRRRLAEFSSETPGSGAW